MIHMPCRIPRPIDVVLTAFVLALVVRGVAFAEGARAERILSLGGSVTEIVHALGEGDRLIARDATSSHPSEVEDLPDVGYLRTLSPEGVLSVDPDLIVAESGAGPPEALAILREAGIPYVAVPDARDRAGLSAKILAVADAIGVPEEGARLAAEVDVRLAEVAEGLPEGDERVLFLLSAAGGRLIAAGEGTSAEAMIEMAGAENALSGFDGYKPVTDEAVAEARPDVILMMDRGGDHGADDETLFAHPALIASPAADAQAVVRMDGLLLLGFGPRTPEAVETLAAEIGRVRGR
ncbi:iron complex transport system substrate-binding protein [Hasllibacter halocynthiae]|uniref:Iron complex transport system substrate-binding protein n=1 Tax=Hasllibacter halocynthiae TaxID=595589 RepID=A0A2T0X9X3_9RHOB|nr:ABC transporter substrate-binding protein [Hasllibacter halocynthiae]PRY95725.1 iron complex transport system substrate-binding protein [Hasllibacter halocynthiae]